MEESIPRKSVLERLSEIPDPRSRRGRSYPLQGLLGMLILAALHGERSLRGMWMWGCKHWQEIRGPLGFIGNPDPPAYSTVWYVLSALQGEEWGALQEWMVDWGAAGNEAISVDGKVQEGSRRLSPPEAALEVVTAVGQELQGVLGQQAVSTGGQVAATIALLRKLPVHDKVVVADAGLLCRSVVDTILEGQGDYLGLVKGNQAEVKEALDTWIEPDISPQGQERSADDLQWNRDHGRVECRELWLVDSRGLNSYLEEEYGWSGVQCSGRIRRSRKHTGEEAWQKRETHTWVSSLSPTWVTACKLAQLLRAHWIIENGVFRVRDVSYDEDRLHGRKIAYGLSMIRNVAITIIRHARYPYIPDGWRDIACRPDHGLSFLRKRLIL